MRLPRTAKGAAHAGLVAGALAAATASMAWTAIEPRESGLALLLVAAALLVAGISWFESRPGSAAEIAVVATLGAAAAAGRVLLAAVPGVQPVTVICVIAGAALGARAGIAVGGIAALVSNLFLGQGPWTPWQMLGWGLCGLAGALLAGVVRRRIPLAILCFVLGMGFSAMMDVWEWYGFYPHTWASFTLVMGRGVPFQLAHAIGNVLIAFVAGPELARLLARYGKRLRVQVEWA